MGSYPRGSISGKTSTDASITQLSKASTTNTDANRASSRDAGLSRSGTLPADDAMRRASRSSSVQREKAKAIGSGNATSVRPIDDPAVNASRSSSTQPQQAASASYSGSAVIVNSGSQHTAVAPRSPAQMSTAGWHGATATGPMSSSAVRRPAQGSIPERGTYPI